jgi:hypothetical protein
MRYKTCRNSREPRKSEVPRVPLPGTSVNKRPVNSTVPPFPETLCATPKALFTDLLRRGVLGSSAIHTSVATMGVNTSVGNVGKGGERRHASDGVSFRGSSPAGRQRRRAVQSNPQARRRDSPRARVHRRAASLDNRGARLREVANQHSGLGHNTPALPYALIHLSAWKGDSAKFASRGLSEVCTSNLPLVHGPTPACMAPLFSLEWTGTGRDT